MNTVRNPHGALDFCVPEKIVHQTLISSLRSAAKIAERTEKSRVDPLRAACIAYVRSYQDVPMDDLRVWAARGSRRFALLITALELLAQEDAR